MFASAPSDQPSPWRVIVGAAPIQQLLELVRAREHLIIVPQDPELFNQITAAIIGHQHEQIWLSPDRLGVAEAEAVWHYFNDCRFDGFADLSTWSTDFPNLRLLSAEAVACVSLEQLISQLANANPLLKAKVEQGGGQLSLYCREPIDILLGAREVLGQFTEISWCPGIRPGALLQSRLAKITSILDKSFFRPSDIQRGQDTSWNDYSWQIDLFAAVRAKYLQALAKNQNLTALLQSVEGEQHLLKAKMQEVVRISCRQAEVIKASQRKTSAIKQSLQRSEVHHHALVSKHVALVAENETLCKQRNELQNIAHNLTKYQEKIQEEKSSLEAKLSCMSSELETFRVKVNCLQQELVTAEKLHQNQAIKIEACEKEQLEKEQLQQKIQDEKLSLQSKLREIVSEHENLGIIVVRLQQELKSVGQLQLEQANTISVCEKQRMEQEELHQQTHTENVSLQSKLSTHIAQLEALSSERDRLLQELARSSKIQELKNLKIEELERNLITKGQEHLLSLNEQNMIQLKLEETLVREDSLTTERDQIFQELNRVNAHKLNQDNLIITAEGIIDEMIKVLGFADQR